MPFVLVVVNYERNALSAPARCPSALQSGILRQRSKLRHKVPSLQSAVSLISY